MTAVNISGVTTTAINCPKIVNITLAGSASGWYTDAIKTASPALSTFSDGYKITFSIGGTGSTTLITSKAAGGCIATATSNAVCVHGSVDAAGTPLGVGLMKVYSLTKATYLATAVVTGGTAVTLALHQMTLILDCALASVASVANASGCLLAGWTADTGTTAYGASWMQPKETSDKVYVGLSRYVKGDTLVYKGLDNTNMYPSVACGSGAVLTGASTLFAGAAVAFGAAALAF